MQESYCLDVYTGYDTSVEVERLIKYLRNTATGFGITKVQRGRMGGMKVLRVMTPKAEELQRHICEGAAANGDPGITFGDDCDFRTHDSSVDARRDMDFMPDYNNPLGDDEFDLFKATTVQP